MGNAWVRPEQEGSLEVTPVSERTSLYFCAFFIRYFFINTKNSGLFGYEIKNGSFTSGVISDDFKIRIRILLHTFMIKPQC